MCLLKSAGVQTGGEINKIEAQEQSSFCRWARGVSVNIRTFASHLWPFVHPLFLFATRMFCVPSFRKSSDLTTCSPVNDVCRPGMFRRIALAVLFSWPIGLPFLVQQPVMAQEKSMSIESRSFGSLKSGQNATLWTLTNRAGNSVQVTDYGATLVTVNVPDRSGNKANINLGFANVSGYEQPHPHYGGTIGRFANRIAAGKFSIGNKQYTLATNNGPNHLHGGLVGFDHLLWSGEKIQTADAVGVRFKLRSPDGQEGYPGTVDVVSEYTWNDRNELRMTYLATTDAATHINLTNHAYMNLAGVGNGKITGHRVTLSADQVLDVDAGLIPTGKLNDVAGTNLDFRSEREIGKSIAEFPATKGYDHCFVVRGTPGQLRSAALAYDPQSGRTWEVETTQPGVQLYTGNHLGGNESSAGRSQYEGFCLETQHFPDAPNKPTFKTTLLQPGEKLQETTVWRFGVRQQ